MECEQWIIVWAHLFYKHWDLHGDKSAPPMQSVGSWGLGVLSAGLVLPTKQMLTMDKHNLDKKENP